MCILDAWGSPRSAERRGHQSPEGQPSSILIRGVALIDPETDAETLTVSLLIMDRRLSLVTQDQVPLAQANVAYDARGGMIL